jgi:hypothetical protein
MKLQVEHKPSNGIHISKVAKLWLRILNIQSSIMSQTDENVEKVCQVISENRWHMIVTF